MKFGEIAVDDAALGSILAHTIPLGDGVLRKGRRIGEPELARLRAAGIAQVVAATLEDGDVGENLVAERMARALAGPGVEVLRAGHGRCNLRARRRGLVVFERARLDAINAMDWRMTVGTASPCHLAEFKERVATVKVMPFAVDEGALRTVEAALAEPEPLVRVAPFRPQRVGLVLSYGVGGSTPSLDGAAEQQRARIGFLGSSVFMERRCAHEPAAIAASLRACLEAGAEIVLFLGVSAVADLRDVFPVAVESIGGRIEHVGMPVEPGNMLVLAEHDGRPVVGVPGCARSLKPSGFDWVLRRLLAGVPVRRGDITSMGAGGLLAAGAAQRPEFHAGGPGAAASAIVLAAGSSRRSGAVNKLLERIDGVPMVRTVAERVHAAGCDPVVVVTGHAAADLRAALAGAPVRFAHNPRFETGMGSSLATGARAVEGGRPVLVALGDMPDVRPEHVRRLIEAHEAGGARVVAPTYDGRRGHPVLFDDAVLAELRACSGDTGARAVVEAAERDGALALVAVDDAGVLLDLDTPAAIEARRRRGDEGGASA